MKAAPLSMRLHYANTQLKHQNPGAVHPLILPVHVVCNTSDEQIYCNIHTNSHAQNDWVKAEEPHDGVAILCGSGPSLKDCLMGIRQKQAAGGKIFALNGAARFLHDHLIYADYQVILDARPETAQLVGPAKEHLFASQVSPELFRLAPQAKLWQLQVTGCDFMLPEYDEAYCLIGGAASVGNTTTCLAYAMGYRDLQLYGYDSCHRGGNGHAFEQKMNEGDPCAVVRFNGKEYIASLTMKLQAEKFQETARELQELGCKIEVHGTGLLPDIFNSGGFSTEGEERNKYQTLWTIPAYREHAPGELLVDQAIAWLGMTSGSVIDFGVGTGRAALRFQTLGFDVLGIDIAENCLDYGVKVPLQIACLWDLPQLKADYGFCTDVMEHIPPEHVKEVLGGIMRCVPEAFFNISLTDDNLGCLIGETLHLSVNSFRWWRARFGELGCEIVHEEDRGTEAMFHVRRTLQ